MGGVFDLVMQQIGYDTSLKRLLRLRTDPWRETDRETKLNPPKLHTQLQSTKKGDSMRDIIHQV